MINDINTILHELNVISIAVRLILALLCGGIVGIERERKSRAAGFKTYMLVCLGATLVMLTGEYLFEKYNSGDVARLGAQVISGIGFLGAGSIIVTGRQQVKGLTTAAGLWVVACLGLAIGSGFYAGALVGMIIIFCIVTILDRVEHKYIRESRTYSLFIQVSTMTTISKILNFLKNHSCKVNDLQINTSGKDVEEIGLTMSIQFNKENDFDEIINQIKLIEGIDNIEEY